MQVGDQEISQYLFQMAAQYGMAPQELVGALSESGQLPAVLAELSRNKTVAKVLRKATVTDSKGKAVDLSEFTHTADDDVEAVEEAAEAAPEKPAAKKKAPAKK